MSRTEFFHALRIVVPVTLAAIVFGYSVITVLLFFIGFQDARLHYTLATLFPLVVTPLTVMPLAVMWRRLRNAKHELEALLRIDAMTGLPNRRAFFERAEAIYARGKAVALMMIDVDHFKAVNDSFGHDAGDVVIRTVAQAIAALVKAAPGEGGSITARFGGEEFVVLLEGVDSETACQLAGRIVERLGGTPTLYSGSIIPTTVSVGVAERQRNERVDDTLRSADNACYRAKRLGRNQWRAANEVPERTPPEAEQSTLRVRPRQISSRAG